MLPSPAVLCALLAAPAAATFSAIPADSVVARRVDEYLTALATQGYTGGVLVLHDGRTVIAKAYGLANRDRGIRADVKTVWNIGSITKQFTAAAILRLEEQGKLHTSDSIARFFPNAPADKRDITLHQLLTHTAGFESDYSPTDYEPTTRDEYIGRMLAKPLRSPPGAQFFYANAGYSMLAAIVELVTGKEYEAALTDLVLRPAGMTETGYTAPRWDPARLAHGYQNGNDWGTIVERVTGPGKPYWELRGNGGLGTTLGDWAKWDAALRGRALLSDSSMRKFTTGVVNEGPAGLSKYAYGWAEQRTRRGTRVIDHNGGNGIFVAEWFRFVDEGVSVFLTSTNAEVKATPIVAVVNRIVFGEPYEMPVVAAGADAATLGRWAGRWALPGGGTITLRVADGGLVADPEGQDAYAALRTGDTASSPRAAELNARAAGIVAGTVKGDVAALVAALGVGGPPRSDVERQERQLAESRRERFGAYRSFTVLGTTPGDEGGLTTVVRLDYERGAATNRYTWGPDGFISDIGGQPYASTKLVARGAGDFVVIGAAGGVVAQFRATDGGIALVTRRGAIALVRR